MIAIDHPGRLSSIPAVMAEPTRAPSGNIVEPGRLSRKPGAREVLSAHASMELVFGVVGHIGSGSSEIGKDLGVLLKEEGFDVTIIKARGEIITWAAREKKDLPSDVDSVGYVSALQDFGDEMRRGDPAAVAISLVHAVRRTRATKTARPLEPGQPVPPDERKRAYILDSLRHPAEADLLRQVYRSSFILLGVVCEEDERERRLVDKFKDRGKEERSSIDGAGRGCHGQGLGAACPRHLPYCRCVSRQFSTSDARGGRQAESRVGRAGPAEPSGEDHSPQRRRSTDRP